jgi:hypothetical protein
MGLFSRFKSRKLFDKSSSRFNVKVKRHVTGKTSITETASPYLSKPFFSGLRKKRQFKRPTGLLIQPPARLRQNSPSKLKKILLIILVLFILSGGTYLIFFTDLLQINDFQIYDEGTQITTNLQLNELVTKSLLNQNLLLYNGDQLTQQILEQFPQYKSISVKKLFPHSLKVELEKYPVAANIIDQIKSPDGLTVQKKFLVNTNGMIIMENEENPELPYIKIDTAQAFGLNDSPLSQERLDYIIKLTNLFEEKFGLKVVEAEYLKVAREVHLRTEKDFTVWFDLNKDMLSQIDKLKRALPKLDIYKTSLEYIDLRISGTNAEKVIYKRR